MKRPDLNGLGAITRPIRCSRRQPGLSLKEADEIRAELGAALVPIARKHCLSVAYLLRLAATGGSAQA